MTYYCGTSGLGALGISDGEPRIVCDGCGVVRPIVAKCGAPPAWFLDGKAPPGWAQTAQPIAESGKRQHWCPRCKESLARESEVKP